MHDNKTKRSNSKPFRHAKERVISKRGMATPSQRQYLISLGYCGVKPVSELTIQEAAIRINKLK